MLKHVRCWLREQWDWLVMCLLFWIASFDEPDDEKEPKK